MVKINNGFEQLREYLFTEMDKKAAAKGPELIQLVSGNPDLETPERIKEAVAKTAYEYHPNPPSTGMPELREAISSYYLKHFGVQIPLENIIVSHGTKSDLWDIGRVFSKPSDLYIVPDPSYPIFRDSGYFEGRTIKPVEYNEEGKWEIPDRFFNKENLALIYLCNPNNPNGALLAIDDVSDIASKIKKTDAMIVSDIVYADFTLLSDKYSPSIFQAENSEDTAVELGGFKAYSMTGHRVSWFASLNDEIIKYWKRFKSNRDKGTPVYMQAAALAALTDKEVKEQMFKQLQEYQERALLLKQGFENMGLEVRGLEHTPFAWIKVPEGHTSEEFTNRLLENASVLVVPGNGFGKGGEGYFRASIFQKKEKLEEALSRIEQNL